MENTRTLQTSQSNFGADVATETATLQAKAERNSIIIEDWFDRLDWTAKLAACMLHGLTTSESERLSGISQHILMRLQEDVIETEGLTAAEDMYIRELCLTIQE